MKWKYCCNLMQTRRQNQCSERITIEILFYSLFQRHFKFKTFLSLDYLKNVTRFNNTLKIFNSNIDLSNSLQFFPIRQLRCWNNDWWVENLIWTDNEQGSMRAREIISKKFSIDELLIRRDFFFLCVAAVRSYLENESTYNACSWVNKYLCESGDEE
jgi:hypothetical protein